MKNKNSSCLMKESDIPKNNKCHSYGSQNIYDFTDGKMYKNGRYFGDIVDGDDTHIVVKCNNENRYMKGQLITIQIVKQDAGNDKA